MAGRLRSWLKGDVELMDEILEISEEPDRSREEIKELAKKRQAELDARAETAQAILAQRKRYDMLYRVVAVASCVLLIGVLIYVIGHMSFYGEENPLTRTVVDRYIREGLQETGAVNVVSGLILDYRAFDTLGESHVLFTALVCVMILLRTDKKNMMSEYEDYYTIRFDKYFDISKDIILRRVGYFLLPCTFVFGIYILLNGQNSPGGGFSGGALLGAALIIFASAFGFKTVDRVMTLKASMIITFVSLGFYSCAKGYVFFTGANHLENHIPKGTPGAILSGGLILPLDIAVGMVVACTMYGFYSLFVRGNIGGVVPEAVSGELTKKKAKKAK